MYKSYFSLKDAQKRYNINKIKYNVFDYSLKNKLIYEDIHSLNHRNAIDAKGYGAEEYLMEILRKKLSFNVRDINSFDGTSFYQDAFLYNPSSDSKTLSGFSHTFLLNNDLYINLENLVLFLEIDQIFKVASNLEHASIGKCISKKEQKDILEYIDSSNTLDALIQLTCALTRKDSLVSNLGWLLTEYTTKDLNTVDNIDMIKEDLKKLNTLKIMFSPGLPCCWMPIKNSLELTHNSHVTGFNGGVLDNSHLSKNDTYMKDALKIQFSKVVIFTIEILQAITTIDSKYQDILYNLLIRNFDDKYCNFIRAYLYNSTPSGISINDNVKKIIEIKDMSERYEAIKEYINKITYFPGVVEYSNNIEYVPIFLSAFVKFCNDYSFRSMRIKIILYLLELLKELGLPLKVCSRDSDSLAEALGDMSGLGIAMESESSNDLINFHFESYNTTPPPETPSERSAKVAKKAASNDILDRAAADFSENGYNFDIKVVTNTAVAQSVKDKYNTIVSKVNLVCKNLTKQIRDIKTYNEGGKNPGQSSGKLDKKAIYRYKYDKNIFYNNTYKVKESDLAFGILLDISGSMRGEGVENGKATMIILHEVLKTLNVNHCIATHNSIEEHQCNIKKYVQFKENANYTINKCYDLATISACYGNCDSGALYFMEQELMRTTNKDKICLIFSDGEPTECSDAELRDQVKHMERLGIKVIGIGINFENIKDYYNDYANGRTLKEMLDIVSNILKQYVLDKKD